MPITINGTTGISGIGGSAATPPVTGADTDTGIFFPAVNTVAIASGGTERLRVDSSGNVGIGTTSPGAVLDVVGTSVTDIFHVSNGTTYFTVGVTSGGASALNAYQTSVGVKQLQLQSAGGSAYFGGAITQNNTTSGQGAIVGEQTFQLAANGTATTQNVFADFFGTTSSISLEASSVYQITAYCVFLKTTAGTAVWQMVASSAPTRMVGTYQASPITGALSGTPISAFAMAQAATTAQFAATGSLTTAVNHAFQFTWQIQTNLATNLRLQLATVTGTGTPLAGSYYTVKKISASTGTFVA